MAWSRDWAFTSLTNREANGLEWKLLIIRHALPLTYSLKPAYELSVYGAWFARHEKESIMAKEFVDVPVPAWVAETSTREIYELKDRRSGEIVAKWYRLAQRRSPRRRCPS